jgi:ribosomal protein S18 acetylase RimI-like enzyme
MEVTYRFDTEGLCQTELEALFKAAELGGRVGAKIVRAFANSSLVCLAFDSTRLIGASRALTDWEYHATIYDVVVHPDYQRRGIGRRMMRELMQRLKVWRIMLVADDGVKSFYRRIGFGDYQDVMAYVDRSNLYDDPRSEPVGDA